MQMIKILMIIKMIKINMWIKKLFNSKKALLEKTAFWLYAIIVLAVLTNVTVVQRILYTFKQLKKLEKG